MKRSRTILGLITIALLVLTVLSVVIKSDVIGDTEIEYTTKKTVGYLKTGRVVEYSFTPDCDIAGLKILFATYKNILNKGTVLVTVLDYDTKTVLAKTEIDIKKIQDNQFAVADTGVLKVKDKKIVVQIEGHKFIPGKYISVWMGENSLSEDGRTYIDGELQENSLVLTTLRCEKGNPYTWELLLLTAFCFFLFVMQWERTKETGGIEQDEEV